MVTLAFVTASLLLLLTPGPTNTLLAAYGAAFGWRSGARMVLAEAAGYAVAVTVFVSIADRVAATPGALFAMKMVAAVWLSYSALQLWHARRSANVDALHKAFARVFLTTMLNPKAMIVGVVLIPGGQSVNGALWTATFVLLAMAAGLVWVAAGSLLPATFRNHAYKGAAVVLGGFSLAAAASAMG